MTARPDQVFDRGLQQERTALAWDRTGLSLLVSSLLYVRIVGSPFIRLAHVPAWLGATVGASLLFLGARRYTHLHARLRRGESVRHDRYLRLAWLSTVLLGVSATVAVLRAG